MNIAEAKEMVNAIIDMNGKDNLAYSPSMFVYQDGSIIVSCFMTNKKTGEVENVQDFEGDIYHSIDIAKETLLRNETNYIKKRIAELRCELETLSKQEMKSNERI